MYHKPYRRENKVYIFHLYSFNRYLLVHVNCLPIKTSEKLLNIRNIAMSHCSFALLDTLDNLMNMIGKKVLMGSTYQMPRFGFGIYEEANSLQISFTTDPKTLVFLEVEKKFLDQNESLLIQ